ncbi:MAG: PQQ-dependent sugar dehydrogenase [Gammaproteobacteria bacterium]
MTRSFVLVGSSVAIACISGAPSLVHAAEPPVRCAPDNGGITLSPGFCATVFADNIGHARHLVVAPDGTVYVNTWSGVYYGNVPPLPGGFLVALKDADGDGRAEINQRFGDSAKQGSAGGTGIALYNGALFAEQNDKIIRYALSAGGPVPKGAPETILSGMPLTGDHFMHPFVIDGKGNLFVDMGSASNTCEKENRQPGSKGNDPCVEQETRGGTWRYDANKTGQKFSSKERYATGIRNGEGMSFDSAGRLYVTQHGRDQLPENWPALFKPDQGRELPAEVFVHLEEGADYGWPRCYFDGQQKKLVLAPEYGGDGGKAVGVCAQKRAPVAFFPAHWAPNDLLIYTGKVFPAAYRGGAFVAFHGSWNRAPGPQGGYNVVFQPMADGKTTGNYVTFADGFAGAEKAPGRATYRPSGLAMGPDGAIYIADDVSGRIWRVVYKSDSGVTQIAAAPAPKVAAPQAGAAARLPTPPGATAEQVALGDRIFHGQASGGTCAGCHGTDAKGTQVGANLAAGKWLWSDGSLNGLADTIRKGVTAPKQSIGGMPPLGGAQLSAADVNAVAAYVWAMGHPAK